MEKKDCREEMEKAASDYGITIDEMVSEWWETSGRDEYPGRQRKVRVNITLADAVHEEMKQAAEKWGLTVSGIVTEGWLAVRHRYEGQREVQHHD